MTLNTNQAIAISKIVQWLNSNTSEFLLTGSAGTGKTFLVKHLITDIQKHMNMGKLLDSNGKDNAFINCTATTNKAAEVMQSFLSNNTQVKTIHSTLGLVVKYNRNLRKEVLTEATKDIFIAKDADSLASVIIIDEASFIDSALYKFIKDKLKNFKVLYIGDKYQLAPVEDGVLAIDSLGCMNHELIEIMRNSGAITRVSQQFKESVMTHKFKPIILDKMDRSVIHLGIQECADKINEVFNVPNFKESDGKVVCWTNNAVVRTNTHIRKIKSYPKNFVKGEYLIASKPIMTINEEVIVPTEGKIRIEYISDETSVLGVKGRSITFNYKYADYNHTNFCPNSRVAHQNLMKKLVKEKNWEDFYIVKNTWLDVRPIYSSTVHKSQGSTYDTVFVNLSDIGKCRDTDQVARLLYVAISRAKNQVILYGQLPDRLGGMVQYGFRENICIS